MAEYIVNLERAGDDTALFGALDENIKEIEKSFNVAVINRDTTVKITGDEENVYLAQKAVEELLRLINKGETINHQMLSYVISLVKAGREESLKEIGKGVVCVTSRGKVVKAKTVGQQKYLDAISKNTIVLGIGPAGTGKTYLAVAQAVAAFREKKVNKIILTRPAVEAGEKLGFLPGDLQTKVDPYLRPLYDALQEMMGLETYSKLIERGTIEVAPLAYMRGRTLSDAFIILDEAQNTTREQMKMFLTRLGDGSKMVVTGDKSQVDLPDGKKSGLVHAAKLLDGVEGIAVINLTDKDVVRNPLVMRIVRAYEREDIGRNQSEDKTE